MEELLKALESYDTPTVSNVVATFPGKDTCLGIYYPWDINWYTDETIHTMFPDRKPVCGFAVTCVYGVPDPNYKGSLGIRDVLKCIGDSAKPAVLVIKQSFPENYRRKCGLLGGNMANAFYSAGCRAVITDGPSRDLEEIRESGLQLLTTGLSAAHGPMGVKAVNVPVSVCSMDVAPGDILHMDMHGAIKFPASCLEAVLERCEKLTNQEAKKIQMLKSTTDIDKLTNYMKGVYD